MLHSDEVTWNSTFRVSLESILTQRYIFVQRCCEFLKAVQNLQHDAATKCCLKNRRTCHVTRQWLQRNIATFINVKANCILINFIKR